MKKGWKIFWIVCACVAGVGLILTIAGVIMGATFGNVGTALWRFENQADQKVERLEDKLDRLNPFEDDDYYDDDYYYDDYYDDDYYEHGYDNAGGQYSGGGSNANLFSNAGGDVVTEDLTGIYELEVDVDYLQVEVQEGAEANQVQVERQNIPEEVKDDVVFVRDDMEKELKILLRNARNWNNVMKNRGEAGTLIVRVPKEHQLNKIKISIGSGVLNAENIQVRELDVEVGAGLANIKQFSADKLDVEAGAGEINIAGDVLIEAGVDCGIGKVNYQASGKETDYSYNIECGVGIVRIGNAEYSGLMNEKNIMNRGALMEIDCGAGEVNVSFTGA